jgi:hypothetical protein
MKQICKQLGWPLLGISFLVASASCAAPQRQQFSISMRSVSDDGQLLAGVQIFHGQQELGTTRESGVLEVNVEASSGSTFDVRFECPNGYQATRDQVAVPLRNAGPATQADAPRSTANAMALTLECRPDERKATIVVKANMANLPVRMGNKILGKTNADGVAYISLNFPAKEVFELSLDTSAESMLHPSNPHFPFVMPSRDEVFVIQESFRIVEPPPPPPAKKKKIKRPPKKAPEKKPEYKRPVRINGVS